jgi:hypothetical protein
MPKMGSSLWESAMIEPSSVSASMLRNSGTVAGSTTSEW